MLAFSFFSIDIKIHIKNTMQAPESWGCERISHSNEKPQVDQSWKASAAQLQACDCCRDPADGGVEWGTTLQRGRGADRSSAPHRHKHPPCRAKGTAAAEYQRRLGDGQGGPRVAEDSCLLKLKAQQPLPRHSEDCLFDFYLLSQQAWFPGWLAKPQK